MKMLFATTNKHLPELKGGMEINTHELAVEFMRRRHEVGVVSGLNGAGWTGLIARLKIKILNCKNPVDKGLLYRLWRSYEPELHVLEVASKFKPDVMVVQGGWKFNELLKSGLSYVNPVVCCFHTPNALPLPDLRSFRNVPHFIANSPYTASS